MYGIIGPITRSMVMPAMPHAMKKPTPIGGRNRPMPVAATTTMEKWITSMPSCFTTGMKVGSRMTTAGKPSSTAPSRMKSSAVRTRKTIVPAGTASIAPAASARHLRDRQHPGDHRGDAEQEAHRRRDHRAVDQDAAAGRTT